jgi:hypothetical protein
MRDRRRVRTRPGGGPSASLRRQPRPDRGARRLTVERRPTDTHHPRTHPKSPDRSGRALPVSGLRALALRRRPSHRPEGARRRDLPGEPRASVQTSPPPRPRGRRTRRAHHRWAAAVFYARDGTALRVHTPPPPKRVDSNDQTGAAVLIRRPRRSSREPVSTWISASQWTLRCSPAAARSGLGAHIGLRDRHLLLDPGLCRDQNRALARRVGLLAVVDDVHSERLLALGRPQRHDRPDQP